MFSGVLLLFLLSACHALEDACPAPEKIAPHCICKHLGDGPMMMCSKLMSPEEMSLPIRETQPYDMFSLAIQDSSLQYIPDKIFLKTSFKKVRLVRTELLSLSETDLAFEGLEDTLEEIRVMGAHYATQWSWNDLRNHKKLNLIDVDWVSLGSLNEPLPKMESLTALAITRADISFIVDYAFKDLVNLRLLVLKNNEIDELKRTMFPDPADQLIVFDLSGNKLDSLPSDFFQGMPSLTDVNLDNNNLVTLKQEVFSSVIQSVVVLSLNGNNLRCDCRMEWLVDVRKPRELRAKCSQPERLKGVALGELVRKVLLC